MKTQSEIKKLRKAVEALATYVEGIAWRVATKEERNAGIAILEDIKEVLGDA